MLLKLKRKLTFLHEKYSLIRNFFVTLSAKRWSHPGHYLQSIYTKAFSLYGSFWRHQGDIKFPVGGTVHDVSSNEIYVARYVSVQ